MKVKVLKREILILESLGLDKPSFVLGVIEVHQCRRVDKYGIYHNWIHKWILHGILSGFKRPSQQKSYPNVAQKLAHYWCCQPVMVRGALVVALLVNLLKVALIP
jgi:hypothetical protein